jgi:hypothetical protein
MGEVDRVMTAIVNPKKFATFTHFALGVTKQKKKAIHRGRKPSTILNKRRK